MVKKRFTVQGMTCSSCEVLLERKLHKVPGVEKVNVSRARGEAVVESSQDINLEELQAALQGEKYILSEHNELISTRTSLKRYAEIGAAALFIGALYLLFKQFNLIPESFGVTDNMGYGFVFILGLIAATSTCLAVSGGLLLAIAQKYNEKYPSLTGWQKFQPHVYFNVGRIVSYTILGGLVGLLGSFLTISSFITGVITIAASALMIIIGIQLLHVFPWLNKIQLKMPKFIAHKVYDASHQEAPSRTASFLFGGATFFLPCGFTQALQLYVLGTGDMITGALTMLAFSLGTLPSLAGIGAFSSFAKGSVQRHFMTFAAVLVIILGVYNIPNGLALTGATIGLPAEETTELNQNIAIVGGKQVIDMAVNGLQYSPAQFTLQQGVPVEWRIDGRKATGCAQVISVPSLGITEYLPKDNVKIITFTPTETGTIQFSCSMGMAGPGQFIVVPSEQKNPTGLSAPTPEQPACDPATQECNVQKIAMEITRENGFYPNTFTVKKGIPIEMEIDTKVSLGGCMGTMVIPEYNIAHRLSLGKTTLKFTPTETGTIPFTCSMGSKLGEFIVT